MLVRPWLLARNFKCVLLLVRTLLVVGRAHARPRGADVRVVVPESAAGELERRAVGRDRFRVLCPRVAVDAAAGVGRLVGRKVGRRPQPFVREMMTARVKGSSVSLSTLPILQ